MATVIANRKSQITNRKSRYVVRLRSFRILYVTITLCKSLIFLMFLHSLRPNTVTERVQFYVKKKPRENSSAALIVF